LVQLRILIAFLSFLLMKGSVFIVYVCLFDVMYVCLSLWCMVVTMEAHLLACWECCECDILIWYAVFDYWILLMYSLVRLWHSGCLFYRVLILG